MAILTESKIYKDGIDIVAGKDITDTQDTAINASNNASTALSNSERAVQTANEALNQTKVTTTQVFVDGKLKESVDFNSDPQEQINSKAGITETYRYDLVYDMTDLPVNALTAGIQGGVSITGLNLSKYAYLRVYAVLDKSNGAFNVDLRKTRRSVDLVAGYSYNGGLSMPIDTSFQNILTCMCRVNDSKTEFVVATTGYVNAGTYNERLNDNYFIYRIEGWY